ncbi:MAG: hypothetical protein ACC654_08250 [Acidimicrobiia bacterium]
MSRISLVVALGLVAVSCTASGSVDANSSSATATVTPPTSTETSTTVEAQITTTSSTAATQITPPRYRIVDRTTTDAPGDTVVVLLDDTSYDSLTDIDLYDIIAEVVELFPPISEVHVVDDVGAVITVTNPDATAAEIQAIQANYLARLDNGFTITYLGPFASSGSAVLGS